MAEKQGNATDSIVVAQAKTAEPLEAAQSIAQQFAATNLAMVVVFVSPFYDPEAFIAEFSRRMPDAPIFGCTTAGELSLNGWEENSVVALGFSAADFVIAARPFLDLSTFRVDGGRSICGELHQEFVRRTGNCDTSQESFGLLFIDGMCQREETIMSAIYAALEDIPVVAVQRATACVSRSHGFSLAERRTRTPPS